MTNSSSKTILLTGYEPWDDFEFNPSGKIAAALNGKELADNYVIHGEVMPVDCRKMPGILTGLIEKYQPQVVVGLGLAFGDSGMRVERIGHNRINITKPDNGGNVVLDELAIPSANAAYFSTFPANDIVTTLLRNGIPAYPSDHAGGHCCNLMLFTALHYLSFNQSSIPCGFLHLPGTPQMVAHIALRDKHPKAFPSMNLELMQQAVELSLLQIVG
jgi:pyroglutamyl-peptidase